MLENAVSSVLNQFYKKATENDSLMTVEQRTDVYLKKSEIAAQFFWSFGYNNISNETTVTVTVYVPIHMTKFHLKIGGITL